MDANGKSWWGLALLSAMRHAGGRLIIVIVIALINPFGIGTWSAARSRALWQEFHAPCYGSSNWPCRSSARPGAGRDAITLVMLDKAQLAAAARGPGELDSIDLLQIFEDVAQARTRDGTVMPKAMFIDIRLAQYAPAGWTRDQILNWSADAHGCDMRLATVSPFRCLVRGIAQMTHYSDWRDNGGTLHKGWKEKIGCADSSVSRIRCIQAARGLPVIVADARALGQAGSEPETPGLAALGAVAVLAPVSVDKAAYDLVTPADPAERRGSGHFTLFPASAMFAAYCSPDAHCETPPVNEPLAAPPPGHPFDFASTRNYEWDRHYDRPLDVTWGIGRRSDFFDYVASKYRLSDAERCHYADDRVGGIVKAFGSIVSHELVAPDTHPCPYSNVLPYEIIGENADFDGEALDGKLIIIGADLPENNDRIAAAPFGDLPGVFYHAMALDNLIELGSHYQAAPAPLVFGITGSDVSNLFWLFVLSVFAGLVEIALTKRNDMRLASGRLPASEVGVRVLFIVLSAGVAFLIVVLVTGRLAVIPKTFNSAALAMLILVETMKIIGTISKPIRVWLIGRSTVLHFLFAPATLPAPKYDPAPGEAPQD